MLALVDLVTSVGRMQACSGGQLLVGDTGSPGGSSSSVDAFCPMCNEMLEAPVTTKCKHTFCQVCILPPLWWLSTFVGVFFFAFVLHFQLCGV